MIVLVALRALPDIFLAILDRDAIRVTLTRMCALLLDEDSLERGACTTISDHNLFRVVEHLWIVDAARARILVLANAACKLLHLSFADHIALPVLVDALGALDSFLIDTVSLN